jgi:hypothetical protein
MNSKTSFSEFLLYFGNPRFYINLSFSYRFNFFDITRYQVYFRVDLTLQYLLRLHELRLLL